MPKFGMSSVAGRRAAAMRREEQALKESARKRAEKAEKTARLKELRLAKQAEDKIIADKTASKSAPSKSRKKAGAAASPSGAILTT